MDFPKKQAQRLMPLYLLEYSEKLFTNHPDPSAPWGGGGGSDYTAGQGITITNNEISVDTNVIATKSDIPTKTSELTNDSGFITEISVGNYAEIVDVTNGFPDETKTAEILANPSKYILHGTTTINEHPYHIFGSYAGNIWANGDTWMQIIRIPAGSAYTGYTLAPYAFCYNNGGEWKGPLRFLWRISYSDVAQTPTLATVATSGSYNDLTDKPTIPDTSNFVTTDTAQTITGLKTIGQTDGTISEVDFSGFTFKLSNKAINHPEADIKIRNGSYDGYQHPIISSTKGLYVNLAKIRLGDDGSNTYGITMPDSSTWEADRVLATTNDIPTVNNPTITFTQGGATKGTITLNQSGDQTIEFDSGASLPDSPFLKVDDPQDQMFFSLDGSESSWSKYVNLSNAPGRMFYVNLSALNPNYGSGLIASYNSNTQALDISLDDNAIPSINPNVPLEPVQTLSTLQVNGVVYGIPSATNYTAGNGIDITNNTISIDNTVALKSEVPSTATSTSTSTVTPATGTFVTGTSTNTTNVVNSVTYTPSSETLTFTYDDNTTASFTFLTSNTTVTSGTTSVVSSVTDSTSTAMTDATVSTSTTTTLS